MKPIEMRHGCVYYYGNPAGYAGQDQGTAVMDNMFRGPELESWLVKHGLTPQWTDGVYDRLANGVPAQSGENAAPLKACRIWQLKPEVDVMMKFVSYAEVVQQFGEPDPVNYTLAYDGQVETNDLEMLWTKFNTHIPPGYTGHTLSMSDVIELYDHSGSKFHYIDRFGFQQIPFDGQEPEQATGMSMTM
ncbi:hypothetical protein LJC60_04055 [Ruminococcaceae bacterium OttesenSCG-928-D13]|nr:hypothetical protein [Ruminococcaceae bacterium OttesenSCG-928-D13]